MLLTLAVALKELEILKDAVVVAGSGGLNRAIRWTHIIDFPDVAPWVSRGDLLLTTAFAFKDNPEAHLGLIPVLAEKELVGMIVNTGPYFNQVPQSVVCLADELDFPIITLPWEVRLADVTKAIHEFILKEQYSYLERSLQIHRVLTELVSAGRGLCDLADKLSVLLNRSITIEDHALELLAYASPGPIDEMRTRTISQGRTPDQLIEYLNSQRLLDRLRENPKPHKLPPIPEIGMTYERIVAPILVGSKLYGYVWIIAAEGPLKELDFLAIEHAATVAALIFSRQEAISEAEQRFKGHLLDRILDLNPYHDLVDLQNALLQLGIHKGYQAMVVKEISAKPGGPARVARMIELEMLRSGIHSLVVQRGQRIVTIMGTANPLCGNESATALLDIAARDGVDLIIGVGTATDSLTNVRQSYQEADEAMREGEKLSRGKPGVWSFDNLGILPWLATLPPDVHLSSRLHRIVKEISDYDSKRGTEYLKTLEVYLDTHGNKQGAARELFIHRNTLRQRLEFLGENYKIDFDDPITLLNLHIALKDWHLNRDG
jgi:purine catabolism regulator